MSEGSDIPGVADRLKSIAAAEREQGRETTVDELHEGLDRYDDEMGPHVDGAIDGLEQLAAQEQRVREECEIRERRDRVESVVDRIDHRAVVAEVDVPVPEPETPGVADPILDTRRSFLEQLQAYKRHNMRSGRDGDHAGAGDDSGD
ncbi:hypothetical protein [Halorubrum salsamenti]|uniref:hypothetical protein n=1 Tax=Halorubrum salsamenti TaxID=2583990 RepID=UPI0011A3C4DD|nr:hypothetical protein [Halorubrum salsamenti]